jgi:predicted DNA-binding transcriptional regulator AlpA
VHSTGANAPLLNVLTPMKKWIEWLEKQDSPIKAHQIAKILGVTTSEVYKLAACGKIPGAIRVSNRAIRFCPDKFVEWLKETVYRNGNNNGNRN